MSKHIPRYFIYDERYKFDEERALVLDCADTLEKAKDAAKEQGGAVIVDSKTGEIIE